MRMIAITPGAAWGRTSMVLAGTILLAARLATNYAAAAHGPIAEHAANDDTPVEDLRAEEDANKRYFLIGPKSGSAQPENGLRLLVVLPGGTGDAGFHPFVKRIFENALPDGYVLAQAVAPQWNNDKNRIVWPTKKLRGKKAKFTTEVFVSAIIKDVQQRHEIDKRHIYLLGWSSGGPPCYAAALDRQSPVSGVFVAMSVFKPQQLPPLARAKGKAFYVLHSPQDFIPMRFPESAVKQLSAKGAKAKLQTYPGGHGWHGDIYGNIRAGIDWLERQTP